MAKHTKLHRTVLLITSAIVVIVLVVAVLELTNTTHFFHARKPKSGTIPTLSVTSDKSTAKPSSNQSSSANSNSPKANATGSAPTATSGTQAPTTPFGSFVSNHRPDLSGSPAPSLEQSVCNTTPGATCYIEFTEGDVVKKLSSQVTDSNGIASWSWDIKQAGFTQGTWHITAVAALNGQTATANDDLSLVVGP